jgi:peroxiredoxin Q/BCP
MRTLKRTLAVLAALVLATPAMAQDATPAPAAGLSVGDLAPDFTLPSSTQAGVDPLPLKLSELRGQVVVIAFFPKSRTKG